MKNLLTKLKEAIVAVLPITLIVLILGLTVANLDKKQIGSFIIGSIFLILGMGLFTLGSEVAMVDIGTRMGASLPKAKKMPFIIFVCFIIGFIVTIAEPDLMVLADQMAAVINSRLFIASISIGVGICMVLAMLRIAFQIPLRVLLIISYGILFLLASFVPKEYLAIAFDSGGVTTGPITVPFIMAFGIGMAATKGGDNESDSFGAIALCTIGPVLAVLVLGLFSDASKISTDAFIVDDIISNGSLVGSFFLAMPQHLKDCGIALLPILVAFLIFNYVSLKLPKKVIIRIMFGLMYVYIGLVLFLTGVGVGFSPVGKLLGKALVESGKSWILIPTGMLIGFFVVAAEPAVHVLIAQVEEISGGTIKKKLMMPALMFSVSIALGLSMVRILTGLSLWWIIAPGYAIALILTLFVPKMFTAIGFDSGTVASGPMGATFVIPFSIGACLAVGGNVLTDAFGMAALVTMSPLLTVQILGLIATHKGKDIVADEIDDTEYEDDIVILNNEDSINSKKYIPFALFKGKLSSLKDRHKGGKIIIHGSLYKKIMNKKESNLNSNKIDNVDNSIDCCKADDCHKTKLKKER